MKEKGGGGRIELSHFSDFSRFSAQSLQVCSSPPQTPPGWPGARCPRCGREATGREHLVFWHDRGWRQEGEDYSSLSLYKYLCVVAANICILMILEERFNLKKEEEIEEPNWTEKGCRYWQQTVFTSRALKKGLDVRSQSREKGPSGISQGGAGGSPARTLVWLPMPRNRVDKNPKGVVCRPQRIVAFFFWGRCYV